MKIGIDIDGTINDFVHVLREFADIYQQKKGYPPKQRRHYNIDRDYGWTAQETTEFWQKYGDAMYAQTKPLPLAVETMQQWWGQKDEIHLITARDAMLEGLTKWWLQKWQIPYTALHMRKKKDAKLQVCQHLGIDYMLEDEPLTAFEIAEFIPVIMMNQYYNENYTFRNRMIIRVHNWFEIRGQIKNAEAHPSNLEVAKNGKDS